MNRGERQQSVLGLLKELNDLEPLKELFWSELNYTRINRPLFRRGWTEKASQALADDPLLFAVGGQDDAFHVIYLRLASDSLLLGLERPVVSRLLRDHPYSLFIFSNESRSYWHFLNVRFEQEVKKRRVFRRITIGPEERLRTATEIELMRRLAPTNKGACHAPLRRKPKSIGSIIAGFKSAVTRRINEARALPGAPVWQRNYYEHVIRNESDLNGIRDYIASNPMRWHEDENNLGKL